MPMIGSEAHCKHRPACVSTPHHDLLVARERIKELEEALRMAPKPTVIDDGHGTEYADSNYHKWYEGARVEALGKGE